VGGGPRRAAPAEAAALKVLVDTSAWIEFLNGSRSPHADAVEALLRGDDEPCTCGIVVAEVFQGLRKDATRPAIERSFRNMSFVETSDIGAYFRAAEVYRKLRERGVTIRSTIDCIIAVIAEESGCALLARDRDIDALLASGLVKVKAWPI
jgi:predicted nucleic acid-binding protein